MPPSGTGFPMTRATILFLVVLLVGAGILLLVGPSLYKTVEVADSVVQTYDGTPAGAPGSGKGTPPPPATLPSPPPSTLSGGGTPPPTPPTPSPAAPAPAPKLVDHAVLVRELEVRKRELTVAQERFAAGTASAAAVEDAEIAVLEVQRSLGEIQGPAFHRAHADLLARRATRLQSMAGAGVVPEEEAALAQLDVERERALAGDPSEYAKSRDAVLATCAKRWAALVAEGALAEDEAAGAQITLEKRFPPPAAEPPAGK